MGVKNTPTFDFTLVGLLGMITETWEPPQFDKRKPLGVKRPFSEQLSKFWAFSEQLQELHSRPTPCKTQFSEQFSERLSEWMGSQGAQNYLPPPPKSKVELWVPKSTVDTQILETQENYIYHSLCGIGQNLAVVVVDSSALPLLHKIYTSRQIVGQQKYRACM